MMTRCYNRKKSNYKSYGCRGVTVCERWHKFENFYADMGDRQPGTSLDRHPSSSMVYCKENCRWATVSQQNLNRSGKRLSSSKYKGVSFCKSNNNWRVTITINKKPVAIGRFKNEKEAAQSYDKKAFELWGTDAYLNFPMEIMK